MLNVDVKHDFYNLKFECCNLKLMFNIDGHLKLEIQLLISTFLALNLILSMQWEYLCKTERCKREISNENTYIVYKTSSEHCLSENTYIKTAVKIL